MFSSIKIYLTINYLYSMEGIEIYNRILHRIKELKELEHPEKWQLDELADLQDKLEMFMYHGLC